MSKFVASLDSGSKSDQKKIEAAFRQTCEKSIKDDNRLVLVSLFATKSNM
jgi:hypothetical protein